MHPTRHRQTRRFMKSAFIIRSVLFAKITKPKLLSLDQSAVNVASSFSVFLAFEISLNASYRLGKFNDLIMRKC